MINWILSFRFDSFLALLLYWTPLAVCSIVFIFRLIANYKEDLLASEKDYYRPSLTVGKILGHVFLAVVPAVNLVCMIFDCSASVFRWLSSVLNIPLVRAKEGTKQYDK